MRAQFTPERQAIMFERHHLHPLFQKLLKGVSIVAVTAVMSASALADEAMRIAVDKAEVVTLKGNAAVVLVANPAIADVVMERNHLLFVVGKRPGETRLYVYDNAGKAVLQRDLVVVPQTDRAVTVVRDTHATSYSCDPRCVTTTPPATQGAGAPIAVPAAAHP
jgi:Flp pilus assembly secretin CpaC